MAYIRMSHPDWARPVLESLAAQNEKEALYPYWLGRLDYDGHLYNNAIRHFQHAIELDPAMARAYDNLGLCYYYQNQNELAVKSYEKAIELGRGSEHPSAWPYLNLAITQQFLNRPGRGRAKSARGSAAGSHVCQGALPAWNGFGRPCSSRRRL